MTGGSADFDMGMQDWQIRRMGELFKAADGFDGWLKDNPRHAAAWLSADDKDRLDAGTYRSPLLEFAGCSKAREAIKDCRAHRNTTAEPEQNALRYKAAKKLIWFAHGQPKAGV